MRGSTVILNEILLHFICMGIITVGIKVIYVCCNVNVNKDCMFGGKCRKFLQCRDTFAWPDRCPYKTGSTVLCNRN